MSKIHPEHFTEPLSERPGDRMAPPGAQVDATSKLDPETGTQHVVERVIERERDPQTGHVIERVVQTIPEAPVHATSASAPSTEPAPSDAPHAPANDQDEIYYEGSPLLRGEFDKVFLYGAIGIILIMIPIFVPRVFHGSLPQWWHWWLTAGFIVAGAVVLLVPLVLTRSIRYRVTNYRINWERGIFGKDIDTLELWHVEDLKFRQNLFQRLMGVGTIAVIAHDDTTPDLILRSVPNARRLFETLQQRVIAVKRGPGVMKVDTGN